MKTKIAVAAMFAVLLIGCAEKQEDTVSSAPPAAEPTASATMDHSAMGHGSDKPDGTMNHAMGTTGIESLRAKTGEGFDTAFLSQMIAHHTAAVQMAKDALGTATKPETKREAQKVIDSQTKEITQMTAWLKDWYNTTPDKSDQTLVNADMKSMMEMPVTTDKMFFEMMIPHHQGAVDMSELALKNAGRAEVKELARKIIAAQKAEIAAYQEIMKNM